MDKNTKALTIRFDLDNERDRAVWEYLHNSCKVKHKTCNNAVIEELSSHIRMVQQSEQIRSIISECVSSSIRREFSRIFDPQPQYHAPVITQEEKPSEKKGGISESCIDTGFLFGFDD